jgi:hypothetical protein
MPQIYMPSEASRLAMEDLVQGFIFDTDDLGDPVLMIKFDAAILTSIVKGCALEIIAGHPDVYPGGCVLMIFDNPKVPLFVYNVLHEINKAAGHTVAWQLEKLMKNKRIRVALFNELLMPVFSGEMEVTFSDADWQNWLSGQCLELKLDPCGPNTISYYPEQSDNGFLIRLINNDHSGEKMIDVLMYDPAHDFANVMNGRYNFGDFLTDGKHGYHQEFSLHHTFSQFFTENENYFPAPLKTNGQEFTDFVILLGDAYLLIESKHVISAKQTKVSKQISKAAHQLKNSDELILDGKISLQDSFLQQALLECRINIRICIYNDAIKLTDSKCTSIISEFEKVDLPMFVSVGTLKEFLVCIYLMSSERFEQNVKENLMRFFITHQHSEKTVLIIDRVGTT